LQRERKVLVLENGEKASEIWVIAGALRVLRGVRTKRAHISMGNFDEA
jgi:hypothetical protein